MRISSSFVFMFAATTAFAEVPAVVVDTAPVHALVSRVMDGIGTPDLLIPPGLSPHDFQFRPSDAGNLAKADIVIWTGPDLAPWLEEPVETLAGGATRVALLETEGWDGLPIRDGAAFADANEHEEHEHGEHEHEEHGHDHDHVHEGIDPHAWLSPAVASVWVGLIAETLADADPGNADAYLANAAAARAELAALQAEIAAILAPVRGRAFIVPHDAYQYFEVAFDMPAAGAVTLSDASSPGPARIAELRGMVADGNIACILTDPETSPEWSAVISEGSLARTAMVDADGIMLSPGPDLYDGIIRGIAAALAECLG